MAFEPWKQDRQTGAVLAVGCLAAIGLSAWFLLSGSYWASAAFGVLAITLAGASLSRLRRAANRKFGKRLEAEFAYRAARVLTRHGFRSIPNVMIRGAVDVDLVVICGNGKQIPVEIKSFRRWNQIFFFKGEREKRALIQSNWQVRVLRAEHGIVWVPQGRPTLIQRIFGAGADKVGVVFGGEMALIRAVKRLNG